MTNFFKRISTCSVKIVVWLFYKRPFNICTRNLCYGLMFHYFYKLYEGKVKTSQPSQLKLGTSGRSVGTWVGAGVTPKL